MAEQEITQTPEFEKAMAEATSPEEIKALIRAEAGRQGLDIPTDYTKVTVNDNDETVVVEDKKKETKKDDDAVGFEDDFVIGGKAYHFEGDSEADIIRQVKAATTAHEAKTAPEDKKVETKSGVLTEDDKVAIELDYKMGKISTDEYLDKTGAFDSYLAKKGIKLDDLKEIVTEKITKSQNDLWNTAVADFLASNADWPANPQNEKIMQYTLASLNLKEPTVDSLNKAYAQMKSEGMLVPVEATKAEPVKKKVAGSGMFGVGGGNTQQDKTVKTTDVPTITKDMSPQEIMQLYKNAAAAAGVHPDEYLMRGSGR